MNNRADIIVNCKSCGQTYDVRPVFVAGENVNNIRVFNLFNYVPCCGACGSNNIILGIHNPYRQQEQEQEQEHQWMIEALQSGMSVVDINRARGMR